MELMPLDELAVRTGVRVPVRADLDVPLELIAHGDLPGLRALREGSPHR